MFTLDTIWAYKVNKNKTRNPKHSHIIDTHEHYHISLKNDKYRTVMDYFPRVNLHTVYYCLR